MPWLDLEQEIADLFAQQPEHDEVHAAVLLGPETNAWAGYTSKQGPRLPERIPKPPRERLPAKVFAPVLEGLPGYNPRTPERVQADRAAFLERRRALYARRKQST